MFFVFGIKAEKPLPTILSQSNQFLKKSALAMVVLNKQRNALLETKTFTSIMFLCTTVMHFG